MIWKIKSYSYAEFFADGNVFADCNFIIIAKNDNVYVIILEGGVILMVLFLPVISREIFFNSFLGMSILLLFEISLNDNFLPLRMSIMSCNLFLPIYLQ